MDRNFQTSSQLNKFPVDWKVKPFWSITKKKSETNNEGLDLLSVYLNQGVVRFDDVNEKRTNVTSEDTSKYQKVERGNLVLNNQQAWRGSVGVSRFEGIVSPAYIVLELSEELETGYSNYLFRDQYMVDNYAMSSKGVGSIQRNIFFPILRTTPVPIPPFQEQKLISRYLDKKTSQIDSLVEKIQKRIQLLKEQRTSLINHYVTKGLDPNVEMKDSGVEWIGEIPKHWKTVKSSYIIDIRDGTHDTPVYVDHGFPLVTQKDIYGGGLSFEKTKMISEVDHMEISKRSRVVRNDIIMSMIGSIGYPTVVETDVEFSIKNVCLFKTSDSVQNPKFIKYVLESTFVANQLELGKGGGVQSFVSLDILRNLKFIVPSRTEQNRIVERLEKKDLQIKDLISAEDRRITLLKEYRQSLISSVVTGKVRVTEDMI